MFNGINSKTGLLLLWGAVTFVYGCKDDPAPNPVDTCEELEGYPADECGLSDADLTPATTACQGMEQLLGEEGIGAFVECAAKEECVTWSDQAAIRDAVGACTLMATEDLPIGTGAEELIADLCGYFGPCQGLPGPMCEIAIEVSGYKQIFALVDDPTAGLISGCIPQTANCDAAETEIVNECLDTYLAPLGIELPPLNFGDTDTGGVDTADSESSSGDSDSLADTADTESGTSQSEDTGTEGTEGSDTDTASADTDTDGTEPVDTDTN